MKNFLIAFASFIVLDMLWLGIIMKKYNMEQLARIGRIENGVFQISYLPAIFVYFLMALAISMFVYPQIATETSWFKVFATGAILGCIIYGVFDFTNLAILKDYPWAFAVPDIAWGSFVFGLVTVLTKKLAIM